MLDLLFDETFKGRKHLGDVRRTPRRVSRSSPGRRHGSYSAMPNSCTTASACWMKEGRCNKFVGVAQDIFEVVCAKGEADETIIGRELLRLPPGKKPKARGSDS